MGLLDDIKGLLSGYKAGEAPAGDAAAHFQQVAQSVDSGTLANGIAAAMRSDQTPPFAQMVSQLFASGNGDQKTAMVNTLLSSVSSGQRTQLASMIPGLGALAAGSGASAAASAASALTPDNVKTLAQHAEKNDAGIIDKMSTLYAAHPALVGTLGTAAMTIAMRNIAQRHA
jgi:hypothetical protein